MRFNRKAAPTTVLNLAGGQAYAQDNRHELTALMLTSFLEEQYYRQQALERLFTLVEEAPDPAFAARTALFARREFGMRSVSHVAAAILAARVKGEQWTKGFFDRIVVRPDDALEIMTVYLQRYGKPVPNALKKGLGAALARFDGFRLAKYRAEGKELSLVDLVNLVHPPHTEALGELIRGTLAPAETWEVRLSEAGRQEDADEARRNAWTEMVRSGRIGYFALLRNLRNIVEQAPEVVPEACALLVDEQRIRGSRVLPFRFTTALEAVQGMSRPEASEVLGALHRAADIAVGNLPALPGKTLVALDGSGSMMGRPIQIGALFAAAFARGAEADVMIFSDEAAYVPVDRSSSVLSVAEYLRNRCPGRGTNFHAVMETADRAYDRIVFLSDMQGWIGYNPPTGALAAYERRTGARPYILSFDLQGYGTTQFPADRIACIAGFSERIFEVLPFLEGDRDALLRRIEAVEL